jgi:hypothetical protein
MNVFFCEWRVFRFTHKIMRNPIARIATDVCASVNAPVVRTVMCCQVARTAEQAHVRRFEGSVHIRRVPVRTEASPDRK